MKQNIVNPRFNDSTFRHAFSDLDHKMCQLAECVGSKVFKLGIEDIDHIVDSIANLIDEVESCELTDYESKN